MKILYVACTTRPSLELVVMKMSKMKGKSLKMGHFLNTYRGFRKSVRALRTRTL